MLLTSIRIAIKAIGAYWKGQGSREQKKAEASRSEKADNNTNRFCKTKNHFGKKNIECQKRKDKHARRKESLVRLGAEAQANAVESSRKQKRTEENC